MSKWVRVKLGDVCEINPSKNSSTKIHENEEISFIGMSAVSETGEINLDVTRKYSEVSKGFTQFIEDDILFAKITPCMENGKGAIARGLKNRRGAGSTEFHILRPQKQVVISEWIYRFTTYPNFRREAEKNMTGSAGQKRVPKSYLDNIYMPLPPLETQKQIAKTLDTAAELLTLRKKQLAELDDLIKSVFYDMFGDPFHNEKGWSVKRLDEISTLITKGSSPTWQGIKYTNNPNDLIFVTSENVRNNYLDLMKPKYIENKFNEIQSRSILQYNDLLINIVGASIGRAAIFKYNFSANINQAVALVRLKSNECPIYISFYLNSPKAIDAYSEMKVEVARANLSLQNIRDLQVIYPPLHLQTKFANIVTQIEEQKAFVKQALDESQHLFNSLMSQYFD